MSTTLAFAISIIWVLALSGIGIFNYKKGRTSLFRTGLFVLFMYAIAHLGSIWLMQMPVLEAMKVHYLFFTAIQAIIAAGLFAFNRNKITTMMGITIFLFLLEAILTLAVHVDRNIVALNSSLTPNLYDSRQWWLWDLRNAISICNNVTVLIAVSLHKVFTIESKDPAVLFNTVEEVEDFIETWEDSDLKFELLDMANTAAELLVHHEGNQFKPKTMTGANTLQKVIELSKYEPKVDNRTLVNRVLYWLRS